MATRAKHAKAPDNVALGAAVRLLRQARRRSQGTLALEAGLHRNYIGAIERGEINPSMRILFKVARGLHVQLGYLLGLTEQFVAQRAADSEAPLELATTMVVSGDTRRASGS